MGANGSLTGYGGGLHRKKWLLEHERRNRESEVLVPVRYGFSIEGGQE
ncbi:MAG: hypothetical protein ACJ74Y_04790 [Bryobacteraceae bacterium]